MEFWDMLWIVKWSLSLSLWVRAHTRVHGHMHVGIVCSLPFPVFLWGKFQIPLKLYTSWVVDSVCQVSPQQTIISSSSLSLFLEFSRFQLLILPPALATQKSGVALSGEKLLESPPLGEKVAQWSSSFPWESSAADPMPEPLRGPSLIAGPRTPGFGTSSLDSS